MHDFGGDFGAARGRREALENVQRRDDLARRERVEAETLRRRLEAQSGRGAGRLPLGLTLAAFSAVDAAASVRSRGE
jgi:hypothetical protein